MLSCCVYRIGYGFRAHDNEDEGKATLSHILIVCFYGAMSALLAEVCVGAEPQPGVCDINVVKKKNYPKLQDLKIYFTMSVSTFPRVSSLMTKHSVQATE